MTAWPKISAISWVPASKVLPGEASHFTPWLAENLDMLAGALGFEDLVVGGTEVPVYEKRLDILATGVNGDGGETPVVIENQYKMTDHRHLGQLVTYLAQQQRGLAVWVVEAASEAHLAAIEFLNRTSIAEVGYALVQVRFTHAAEGYQVHFEVLAKPNVFVQGGPGPKEPGTAVVPVAKKAYLGEILERTRPLLEGAGLKHVRMHTRAAYIEMRFPGGELDEWGARLIVRVTQHECSVGVHVSGFDTREENSAALEVVRAVVEPHLPHDLLAAITDWHAGAPGAVSDFVRAVAPGLGYKSGVAENAASWAGAICVGWASSIKSTALPNMRNAVDEVIATDAAGDD